MSFIGFGVSFAGWSIREVCGTAKTMTSSTSSAQGSLQGRIGVAGDGHYAALTKLLLHFSDFADLGTMAFFAEGSTKPSHHNQCGLLKTDHQPSQSEQV